MYKVVSRVNLKFCSNSFSLKNTDDSSIAELRFLVTRIKKYSSIEKAFSPLPPPRRSFPRRKQVLSRTFFFFHPAPDHVTDHGCLLVTHVRDRFQSQYGRAQADHLKLQRVSETDLFRRPFSFYYTLNSLYTISFEDGAFSSRIFFIYIRVQFQLDAKLRAITFPDIHNTQREKVALGPNSD